MKQTIELRLLETSDLHMAILDHDYFQGSDDPCVGLARVASLVAKARAEAPNALLFDNGDIIQGNPLGDHMARAGHPGAPVHPMIRAMNRLGYDAATVGNHEFNYGIDFLDRTLAGAAFAFTCANLETVPDRMPWLPPWLVLERELVDTDGMPHRLRIGVIGLVTPQVVVWDRTHLQGRLTATDMVAATRRHLPALRARCDLVVALCHGGISDAPYREGEENAALHLAEIGGIDAILCGHTHRVFPGPDHAGLRGVDAEAGRLAGVPAVMPGYWGSHLGVIDLALEREAAGWRVAGAHCAAWPIGRCTGDGLLPLVPADPAIQAEVLAEHEATLAWMEQPVGNSTVPIHSYFSLLGNDAALGLVNAAQLWCAAPLLAGTAYAGLPLLSAAAPHKAGGTGPGSFLDLDAGPLTMRDIASLSMFANTLCVVQASGAELREWLERSCAIFNRIDPGQDAPQELTSPRAARYLFDTIAGLSYEIDLSQPSRYGPDGALASPDTRRIVSLRHGDRPVRDDQRFLVVTNNYRADGGGRFPGTGEGNVVLQAPDLIRDAITRYVLAHDPVTPEAEPVWRFRGFDRAVSLAFDGTERTARHLADRPELRRLGPGDGGFTRYALTLAPETALVTAGTAA